VSFKRGDWYLRYCGNWHSSRRKSLERPDLLIKENEETQYLPHSILWRRYVRNNGLPGRVYRKGKSEEKSRSNIQILVLRRRLSSKPGIERGDQKKWLGMKTDILTINPPHIHVVHVEFRKRWAPLAPRRVGSGAETSIKMLLLLYNSNDTINHIYNNKYKSYKLVTEGYWCLIIQNANQSIHHDFVNVVLVILDTCWRKCFKICLYIFGV